MISGHMVKAGRVPSIPRSGSQEQEAAGQQAHAAQSTASAHAKRAVSTAASRKLNFLTEEQMAQCTDEAPCNCTDCIFFDTTVDGSLIGICGLCSTVATYDVRCVHCSQVAPAVW